MWSPSPGPWYGFEPLVQGQDMVPAQNIRQERPEPHWFHKNPASGLQTIEDLKKIYKPSRSRRSQQYQQRQQLQEQEQAIKSRGQLKVVGVRDGGEAAGVNQARATPNRATGDPAPVRNSPSDPPHVVITTAEVTVAKETKTDLQKKSAFGETAVPLVPVTAPKKGADTDAGGCQGTGVAGGGYYGTGAKAINPIPRVAAKPAPVTASRDKGRTFPDKPMLSSDGRPLPASSSRGGGPSTLKSSDRKSTTFPDKPTLSDGRPLQTMTLSRGPPPSTALKSSDKKPATLTVHGGGSGREKIKPALSPSLGKPASNPRKLGQSSDKRLAATSAPLFSGTSESSRSGSDEFRPRISFPAHIEPTYFIGGGNGNAIIEDVMNGLGWRRIKDKLDESYRLKWCELKSAINYNTFREGEQLVNHIPNCNLLTNKQGLLTSLQEYERVTAAVKKRSPRLDFLPETFKLDDPRDLATVIENFNEGDIWICKPTGRNQGKGIYLVRSVAELMESLQPSEEKNPEGQNTSKPQRPLNRIIQRYISNPLLINRKKFDLRAYMLIASTVPYLVVFHEGYVRISMCDYDKSAESLQAHLTNQFIQKKDPMYKDAKEDTVWSMEKLNDYINKEVAPEKDLEPDWAVTTLYTQMKQIMTHCFTAVKHRLHQKVGYFDLYGFDFMVDEEMKVWLIEVNVNPTLATNCEALKTVIPDVTKETLYLAIECMEKARRNKPLLPLHSLNGFQMIYCGSSKPVAGPRGAQASSGPGRGASQASFRAGPPAVSPVRRSRSLSPLKETGAGWAEHNSGGGGGRTVKQGGTLNSLAVPRATATSLQGPGSLQQDSKPNHNANARVPVGNTAAAAGNTAAAAGGRVGVGVGGSLKRLDPAPQLKPSEKIAQKGRDGRGVKSPAVDQQQHQQQLTTTLKMTHADAECTTAPKPLDAAVTTGEVAQPITTTATGEKLNRGS